MTKTLAQHGALRQPLEAVVPPRPVRPLRVCYLIDELATAGTETQLLALLRNLDRRRVLPHLALLHGNNPISRALEPDCCPVLRLDVRRLRSPKTLLEAWRFARFLRHQQIDVLQAYFPDSSYFGVTAAWLAGVPHRVRTRNNLGHWLTPQHRLLGRLLQRFTTATVVNCQAARAALLRDKDPKVELVVVLENGTDLDRFVSLPPAPPGPRRVGAVANLRPVKGLEIFVQAAQQLARRHADVVFTVAGEGEGRSALDRLASDPALNGRFLLPGIQTDIPAFLAGLHIAVLSSRAEGMSNALIEYMAAGRPIVATAVGAAPDLIVDGMHGLLVPPGDAAQLAAAIDRLLCDPELGRRLGRAARSRAQERFGRAAMVRRFEEFYERLSSGDAQ